MTNDEKPPLGFLLVRMGETLDRRFVQAMEALQLRPRELRALYVIGAHPGCSQRELARRMPSDPGNLVAILDRLQERGLIVREVGADRRRRTLELTHAGADLLARAVQATREVEDEVLAPLSADERAALEDMGLRVWRALTTSPEGRRSPTP
ncbi:MAG TPA: MarR family transcriptional regulator [Solirubrobacter sp.]|nr:MarR family transcriptional regulator [Solirubrobacter sp.]